MIYLGQLEDLYSLFILRLQIIRMIVWKYAAVERANAKLAANRVFAAVAHHPHATYIKGLSRTLVMLESTNVSPKKAARYLHSKAGENTTKMQ